VSLPPLPLLSVIFEARAADVEKVVPDPEPEVQGHAVMVVENATWTPTSEWKFCIDKRGRDGGTPAWVSTYDRWVTGAALTQIATNIGGKPVKLETVRGHIVQAFMRGRPVDIARLAAESHWALPDWGEWSAVERAATALGMTPELPDVRAKDLVAKVVATTAGDDGAGSPAAESAGVSRWYECITWWTTLKRAGYAPVFGCGTADERSTKRRKTC
jgi:Werner syndrome ATP-dependent helicase